MSGLSLRASVVAVGRFSARDPEKALYDTYAARLRPALELVEVEEKRLTGAARQKREGELLLGAVPSGAAIVVLDGRGRCLSSEELADCFRKWAEQGIGRAAFLIGGADGHEEWVLRKANLCYSFGPATWPHMMVRAMLAEQIYRAGTILSGHPYHRARVT